MKRNLSKPCGAAGLMLVFLAALRCTALDGGLMSRIFVPVYLLLIGALALLLLRRSGYDARTLAVMLAPIGLALFVRALFFSYATLDYQDFLSQWVEYFRQNGGLAALKDPVGNYNVPYLYMLALISYLPIPDLYLIKLFSIVFDVLLAWGGLRIVKHFTMSDSKAPLVCFAALLLLPTAVLNSGAWAQCDAVYAALCVLSLACVFEKKPVWSLALLALAFSFKLQAVFLIPLWLALWLTGRVKFKHLLVFPAVFVGSMVPALAAGKPVGDILSIYLDQAGSESQHAYLNFNSPSIFSLVPHGVEPGDGLAKVGIAAAFLFVLAVLGLLLWKRKSVTDASLLLAGAALAMGIPFFLPYMHERYFFLGGVLALIWACAAPFRSSLALPAAVGAEVASLGGYHAYFFTRYALVLTLFGTTWTTLTECLLMLFALTYLTASLVRARLKGA